MRSPTPAPRRMAPPQAGPPQATPPQAGPPQATPPQAGPPQAGPPQAARPPAGRLPADSPPAGAARPARPRWCGPARRASGWCSPPGSRPCGGSGRRAARRPAPGLPSDRPSPDHRAPSDFPMADGARCCGASAPYPCRCHGSRPELHREIDAGHPAGADGDTHAPPGGATVGPGADLCHGRADRLEDRSAGVITYANDVFLRVSAYPAAEVIGQPHNLIRHPDMPRAVFKLLWDTLAERREVFAYIDNLAADGANYWVLAHMTPSYGSNGAVVGYHSSRRRPSRGALDRVRPLYERLLAEERKHPNARAAVEASGRLLQELVAEQAVSYEEFIWSIIADEEA